jgi:hypothetical protein
MRDVVTYRGARVCGTLDATRKAHAGHPDSFSATHVLHLAVTFRWDFLVAVVAFSAA